MLENKTVFENLAAFLPIFYLLIFIFSLDDDERLQMQEASGRRREKISGGTHQDILIGNHIFLDLLISKFKFSNLQLII